MENRALYHIDKGNTKAAAPGEKTVRRFAVCDDNDADAAFVVSLIKSWNQGPARCGEAVQQNKAAYDCTIGLPLQIDVFGSAEAFLFAFEAGQDYDILFLDIEMGGMSGVELARRLRQMGAGLQIVFITGYMDYISDGYDVEALHYLMKPVTGEKLGEVLCRAIERMKIRERELVLPLPDGMVRIPLHEIRYIEVLKNYVTVHAGEDYRAKRTLNELEKELDESFFRLHRSYIAGLRFIRRVTKTEVVLKDGTVLPLSRKLYDNLNQALIHYF